MAQDTLNPFQRMAKLLASRRQGEEPSRAPKSSSHQAKNAPSSPSKVTRQSHTGQKPSPASHDSDKEDSALFLSAMSSASPLQVRGRRRALPDSDNPSQTDDFFPPQSLMPDVLPEVAACPARDKTVCVCRAVSSVQKPSGVTCAVPTRQKRRHLSSAGDHGTAIAGEQRTDVLRSIPSGHCPAVARGDREEAGQADALLFAQSMQGVSPLANKGREVPLPVGRNKKLPFADPAKALRDILEGHFAFALYHSDEFMEGHVVGIDPMILARLRAGQFSPEAHLDLHGQNAAQTRDSLTWFIKNAYQRGMRTLLVVTGRGKNSPDGVGVLRPLLQRWLSQEPFKRVVLAFCTAKPGDGGPGAIYVLLRKYKKNRGKIIWDHHPFDEDLPDA
ncbi:MAG: Smr/MutS family protein [Desulfovibrio sp.]|jgi:DNA-nicking Smr family endonuclease|nr:Smr/MutS family protein [Desulfovibrio sp.]